MQYLVDDILLIILENLRLSDVNRMKLVSSRFNKLIIKNYEDTSNYKLDFHKELNDFQLINNFSKSSHSTTFGRINFRTDTEDCDEADKYLYSFHEFIVDRFDEQKSNLNQQVSIYGLRLEKYNYNGYEIFKINNKHFSFYNNNSDFRVKIYKNELLIFKNLVLIYKLASTISY